MADQTQSGGQDMEPNMNFSRQEHTEEFPLPKTLEAGIGFGVASLVLGLMSLGLAIFIIGAAAGLLGLIFAIIHLTRRLPFRKLAIAGLVLSLIGGAAGLFMGVIFGIGMYKGYKTAMQSRDIQFEDYYGKEAPDLTLDTTDGNVIKLSDLKGKRVMLDFFATWCGPCKKEIPHLIKLRETISPDELVLIGVSSESANTVRPFKQKMKINYPLVGTGYDVNLPEPFSGVTTIPTVFFIDANGVIESSLNGYQPFYKLKEYALGTASLKSSRD
jgi:peroxiredoxin